jgi:hypothetical protein
VARWGEFKKVAGVLDVTVPVDTRSSFYARWGDCLPGLCWLVLGGWVAGALLFGRAARAPLPGPGPAAG